jgi:multiple sugar transport system permease protein
LLIQRKEKFRNSMVHLILISGSIIMVLPFIWMISTSLKNLQEAIVFPPIWIPSKIVWSNYTEAFFEHGIGRAFFNSIVVSIIVVFGRLFTAACGAYAFARLRFPGRDYVFLIYLATMMIPIHVTIVPMFIMMKNFGWVNTYNGLIIPQLFTPFGTFLLRQFFKTIPKELEEAVLVDGGGRFRIFWSVILPLSKPALTTLAIFEFTFTWNNLLWPLIIISKKELFTLPISLALFVGEYVTIVHLQMAAAVIATIPLIILFIFAQKSFIRGVALSGLKE